MGVVNPLTKEQATPEVRDTFEKLAARAGKVPNIFAVMAHRPAVLNTFLPLYKAVIHDARGIKGESQRGVAQVTHAQKKRPLVRRLGRLPRQALPQILPH